MKKTFAKPLSITKKLKQGCRDFALPAELVLANGETLLCSQLLRVLPAKRAVLKARWRGKTVLVKLILNTRFYQRNVQSELAGYERLKVAKIMTPRLILTAQCADQGSVLIFDFLEGAQSLEQVWKNREGYRTTIACDCMRLIAKLHRGRCQHVDLHTDNFLVVGNTLYLIDVAAVKQLKNHAYGTQQRKNLALFLAQFAPLQRQILLATLADCYPASAVDRKLERAIERSWKRRKSNYLKKCFRECSEFSIRKNWYQKAVWKREAYCDDLISFLQHPDAWVASGKPLKEGNSATVVCTQMGERRVVIKRNNIKKKNVIHQLKCHLFATRSHSNWHYAHVLKINDIATPDPIAFVEIRRGPLRLKGYYVSAFEDSPTAAEKYAAQFPTQEDITKFRLLFKAMYLAKLYHGDLKSSNLLVTEHGIALIDLDYMKECWGKLNDMFAQKARRRFLRNWENTPKLLQLFSQIF